MHISYQKIGSINLWIAYDLVILSGLCLWQIKPISEFDERENV